MEYLEDESKATSVFRKNAGYTQFGSRRNEDLVNLVSKDNHKHFPSKTLYCLSSLHLILGLIMVIVQVIVNFSLESLNTCLYSLNTSSRVMAEALKHKIAVTVRDEDSHEQFLKMAAKIIRNAIQPPEEYVAAFAFKFKEAISSEGLTGLPQSVLKDVCECLRDVEGKSDIGIWLTAFITLTGFLNIITTRNKSGTMVTLSGLVTGVMYVASLALFGLNTYYCIRMQNMPDDPVLFGIPMMLTALVILPVINILIGIITAAFLCRAGCSCCQPQTPAVMYLSPTNNETAVSVSSE